MSLVSRVIAVLRAANDMPTAGAGVPFSTAQLRALRAKQAQRR